MILTGERMILNRMKKETEVEHICRYQFAKQFVTGKRVLDAACGSGYGTKILAEDASEVTGIDISAEAVAYAEKEYKQSNTRYLVGSVEKMPFADQSFDVIISFETIEHIDEIAQDSFLSEIKRVIKNDGILIISTPNKKKFTDERGGKHSEYHVKEFYVEEFRKFLARKFDYVIFQQQFYAKSACIIDSEGSQAQITDFNDEGMYVIAIASNMDIRNVVRTSFIMRYPEKYEMTNDFVQVFYSQEKNYSEENSQLVEIDNRNEFQEVYVKLDGIKCRYLRIDPITGRGIIRVIGIKINLTSGEIVKISEYTSNADREENGDLYFYNKDPQIYISLMDEEVIDSLEFKFIFVNYINGKNGDDTIIHFLLEQNENLERNNNKLWKENNELQKESNDLRKENNELEKKMMEIYNSKMWKVQQKIAKILRILGMEK